MLNKKLVIVMTIAFVVCFLTGFVMNYKKTNPAYVTTVLTADELDAMEKRLPIEINIMTRRWTMYCVAEGYPIEVENINKELRGMYNSYSRIIKYHGINQKELPFRWLVAMMFVESKGNPMARGSLGEYGLFQTLPIISKIEALKTAGLIKNVEDLYIPEKSCAVAAYTMCFMLKSQGTLDRATKYYNAGTIKGSSGVSYLKKVKKEYEEMQR